MIINTEVVSAVMESFAPPLNATIDDKHKLLKRIDTKVTTLIEGIDKKAKPPKWLGTLLSDLSNPRIAVRSLLASREEWSKADLTYMKLTLLTIEYRALKAHVKLNEKIHLLNSSYYNVWDIK